jgi:hypothetical protein
VKTNAKHQFTHPTHPGRRVHTSTMFQLLGLTGSKLPTEGMPARDIKGIQVWVNPLPPMPAPPPGHLRNRKRSTHRVMCRCPDCAQELSAGRLHQHVCEKG